MMTTHPCQTPSGLSTPQAIAVRWCAWITAAVVTSVLLVGCDGNEIEVYELPKLASETPAAVKPSTAPSVQTNAPSPSGVPTASPTVSYTLPAGWSETSPGRMVLRAIDCGAGVTATVTAFPGDVGGVDANVARWGRQLGLGPESLAGAVNDSPVGPEGTLRARLANAEQAVLVDIIAHQGSTWFFKLTGPIAPLDQRIEAFNAFVASVDLDGSTAGSGVTP